mmetsp:Transcript_125391/g.244185  ORF Transcript_125391/g.244185 Transcript_125391/m.244185 type:complete len:343 (-) Transcript_125391:119-1147(-)
MANGEVCCFCPRSGRVAKYGLCPLCDGASPESDDAEPGKKESRVAGIDKWPLRAVAVPGAGLGLVATRLKAAGDLIIGEAPLLTVIGMEAASKAAVCANSDPMSDVDGTSTRFLNARVAADDRVVSAVAAALDDLSPELRREFLELSDSFSNADLQHGMVLRPGVWVSTPFGEGYVVAEEAKATCGITLRVAGRLVRGVECQLLEVRSAGTLGGIFFTNAVGASTGDVFHVYPIISRLNHSCRPNAVVAKKRERLEIYAVEDIAPSEEVRISYMQDYDADKHSELRAQICHAALGAQLDPEALLIGLFRQKLFVKWGFWCLCCRCIANLSESEAALERWQSF